jgi:arylsulfatase A-like enzyme
MTRHFQILFKRFFIAIVLTGSLSIVSSSSAEESTKRGDTFSERPNILVIFTDDQGYGDLSCFGSTEISTPRIDSLAEDGTRFTSFYVQTVCGPSRSALLTGRYPIRSGGWSMPASEITVAELLKQAGYRTCCLGKWDVSNRAAILDRMPNAQGFDYYWGTLGANDNGSVTLHENNKKLENTSDMASLTRRYTDKAIEFIQQNADQPFFLYLAHTMVHSVIDASPEFRGKSKAGLYGDTVEEIDFHTGRLLDTLDSLGLRKNTLVIFTTDNGPWNNFQEVLSKKHHGQRAWGSSGPLREGKGSTYEGGVRVPCLVRWPERVPAKRTCDAIFSTIDFLPTFARLAHIDIPNDRIIDGVDQTDLLCGKNEQGRRNDYFYFCKNELHAIRRGNYKLILPGRKQFYGYVKDKGSQDFELYDLSKDIGEQTDLASMQPETVQALKRDAEAFSYPSTFVDEQINAK